MVARGCSVTRCNNNYRTTKNGRKMVSFYTFPKQSWLKERRRIWIQFARREPNEDGSPWEPTNGDGSSICSEHFWGGEKSEDPRKINYNPTIYNPREEGRQEAKNTRKRGTSEVTLGDLPASKGDPNKATCIFCATSSGFRGAKGSLFYPSFVQFCGEILGKGKRSQDFVETLASCDSLTVCGPCLSATASVVNRGEDMKKVEARVSQLQRELLKELGTLHQLVEELQQEMRNIQETVQGSDASRIKQILTFEGNSKPALYQHAHQQGGTLLLDFRERLATTSVENVEEFGKTLKAKISCAVDEETRGSGEWEVKPDLDVKMDGEDSNEEPGTPTSNFYNEGSDGEEEEEDELKVCVEGKEEEEEEDELKVCVEGKEEEEEGNPDLICADPLQSDQEEGTDSEWEGSDDEEEIADGEEEEGTPIDFQGMSSFRKKVIQRVLLTNKTQKVKAIHKNRLLGTYEPPSSSLQKSPSENSRDWLKTSPYSKYPLQYDPEKQWLHVRHLGILIQDKERRLQCAQCTFSATEPKIRNRKRPIQTILWNHLLSRHFDLYRCPVCSSRLCTLAKFREHFHSHENKYSCEICARPLSSSSALTSHRWTHMSAAEQQSALRQGHVEPYQVKYKRLKKMEVVKPFSCSKCAKRFKTAALVREHEETHQEVRARELCPRCGRNLLLKNIRSHQLFCGVTTAHFKCDLCQKAFKNRILLRHHRKIHFGEPTYLCTACPKVFKDQRRLTAHQLSHAPGPPVLCEKGCGGGFKNKRSARHHAKLCQGNGTPFRKKAKQVAPPTHTPPGEAIPTPVVRQK